MHLLSSWTFSKGLTLYSAANTHILFVMITAFLCRAYTPTSRPCWRAVLCLIEKEKRLSHHTRQLLCCKKVKCSFSEEYNCCCMTPISCAKFRETLIKQHSGKRSLHLRALYFTHTHTHICTSGREAHCQQQ